MDDSSNERAKIAAYKPVYFEPETDQTYLWCSCGLSQTQPFCDQSHRGTGFRPLPYRARAAGEEVLFCACKQTREPPFCDGSHNNLRAVYEEDDPHSEQNRRIPSVAAGQDGRAVLDGGCFVRKVDGVARTSYGDLEVAELISAATGARYQSQFYGSLAAGSSPVMAFGDSHVVLFVTGGEGRIVISGQDFELAPDTGVYIMPHEAFMLTHQSAGALTLFISVCPVGRSPRVLAEMPDNFDSRYPQRCVAVDAEQRQTMADRFFQVLVDERVGSSVVTQFIGEVPLSKAAPHRHLYEESIVVLRGEGQMWTESVKTPVAAGDILFLPRKQLHSLECTDPNGMLLLGVIYPGNNPAINY